MYPLQLSRSFVEPQTDDIVREVSIGKVLREVATGRPSAPALVEIGMEGEPGRSWSYGELLSDSEKLALALSTRFRPGEHIAVWAPNIPEWLLIEYACALAGLVLVTANPAYQANELRYVLEQSGSVALFLVTGYRGNPMSEIAVKATEGLDAVREIVDMEDPDALHRIGDEIPTLPVVEPTSAAQIQYTSGSTGFPKGAMLPHIGLVNNARFTAARAKVPEGSTWTGFMPLFHTGGCGWVSLGCLQAVGRMLLFKIFDPNTIIGLIETERVTKVLGVPTMIVELLEALKSNPRDISSVVMVTAGGSVVAPELVRRIRQEFGCPFENVYGMTETCPIVTQHHGDDSFDDVCHTVGQPLPQTAVSIRNVDTRQVVPIDTVGEICVRGYGTMIGYHGNDAATAETIDDQGWLRTGDLGAMDSRGYVRITGRLKDMIIRGGENIYPAEIEIALFEHPGVAEVAVIGLPDDKWGEIVACFIRPAKHQIIDPEQMHRYCREHLSPQKTPVVWCTVDDFPRTGSRKIQKTALRDGYIAGTYGPL